MSTCILSEIRKALWSGRINLSVLEDDRTTAELGYRIGENVSNLGYASEAVKLVLDKAFTTYGFNRIIAGTATDNQASQRVLIKMVSPLVE